MQRRLDAVLLLDKPSGITSNAALQQAKRMFRAAKAGHCGTLDPLASGLLPVLFGEATKFSRFLLDADKGYRADVHLGVATSTGDGEGEVVQRCAVTVGNDEIGRVLARFRGEQMQVPPMHSALKHRGRPLYALAREGARVARAPRRVVIHALEFLGRAGDVLTLQVACSKGTYLRTLAQDLGTALGTGAHLAALRRTASGPFGIDQAVALHALADMSAAARDRHLLPVEALLAALPRVELEPTLARKFLNGQPLPRQTAAPGRYRVYGADGALLGIGDAASGGGLRPVRLVSRALEPSQAAEIPRKSL